jgi:hypothetical protein
MFVLSGNSFQLLPDFPRRAPGPGNVMPPQLGIALGHLDIRMAEDFRELVKIAAVHHEPGRKCVTEIVESEILNPGPLEQVFKTSLHALPSTRCPWLRRKSSVTPGSGVVETTSFNTRFQPTQVTAGSLITLGSSYGTGTNGTVGNNGNVQTAWVSWQGGSAFNQYFVYDPLNRLLVARENSSSHTLTPPSSAYQSGFNSLVISAAERSRHPNTEAKRECPLPVRFS